MSRLRRVSATVVFLVVIEVMAFGTSADAQTGYVSSAHAPTDHETLDCPTDGCDVGMLGCACCPMYVWYRLECITGCPDDIEEFDNYAWQSTGSKIEVGEIYKFGHIHTGSPAPDNRPENDDGGNCPQGCEFSGAPGLIEDVNNPANTWYFRGILDLEKMYGKESGAPNYMEPAGTGKICITLKKMYFCFPCEDEPNPPCDKVAGWSTAWWPGKGGEKENSVLRWINTDCECDEDEILKVLDYANREPADRDWLLVSLSVSTVNLNTNLAFDADSPDDTRCFRYEFNMVDGVHRTVDEDGTEETCGELSIHVYCDNKEGDGELPFDEFSLETVRGESADALKLRTAFIRLVTSQADLDALPDNHLRVEIAKTVHAEAVWEDAVGDPTGEPVDSVRDDICAPDPMSAGSKGHEVQRQVVVNWLRASTDMQTNLPPRPTPAIPSRIRKNSEALAQSCIRLVPGADITPQGQSIIIPENGLRIDGKVLLPQNTWIDIEWQGATTANIIRTSFLPSEGDTALEFVDQIRGALGANEAFQNAQGSVIIKGIEAETAAIWIMLSGGDGRPADLTFTFHDGLEAGPTMPPAGITATALNASGVHFTPAIVGLMLFDEFIHIRANYGAVAPGWHPFGLPGAAVVVVCDELDAGRFAATPGDLPAVPTEARGIILASWEAMNGTSDDIKWDAALYPFVVAHEFMHVFGHNSHSPILTSLRWTPEMPGNGNIETDTPTTAKRMTEGEHEDNHKMERVVRHMLFDTFSDEGGTE